jgi:hypothetical protein
MRRDVAHDPMRARPSARLSEGASFGSVSLLMDGNTPRAMGEIREGRMER